MRDEAACAAHVVRVLRETSAAHERAATGDVAPLVHAAATVTGALRAGRKLLVFGNGGSAADAQHLATEFTVRFVRDRAALPALALTADTATLTAIGNDYGFDAVFERQLRGLARPGDALVCITTSGRSVNVIKAAEAARGLGVRVVAFLGPDPSPLDELAEVALHVDGSVPGLIQQGHITIGQALCGWVEARLSGD
jgi:D-sedoheptulose 7-phosphate isomerase